jgi:hypothetical protein
MEMGLPLSLPRLYRRVWWHTDQQPERGPTCDILGRRFCEIFTRR